MGIAVKDITEEFSLRPRGAWITVLVAAEQVLFPQDLARVFRIGRSLITAELNRLAEAGLITYAPNAADGRRAELKLTRLGDEVQRRVKSELSKLVLQRLGSYRRDDILLCTRMLRDFRLGSSEPLELPGAKPPRKKVPRSRRGSS